MSRIHTIFTHLRSQGRAALMPYLMLGYPERGAEIELAVALEQAGADLFELGVPFSDPLADGATVQRASEHALRNGVRPADVIDSIKQIRACGVEAALVPMGYYNPFLQYGLEQFTRDAAAAGADGLIIPDLPPEEAERCQDACTTAGLDLIRFVAPTTPEERIEQIVRSASGFLYCVALTGVTGARTELWAGLPELLQRVRQHTDLPLVVGFGISSAAHVRQVSQYADGAIVASALIAKMETLTPQERVSGIADFVRELSSGRL